MRFVMLSESWPPLCSRYRRRITSGGPLTSKQDQYRDSKLRYDAGNENGAAHKIPG